MKILKVCLKFTDIINTSYINKIFHCVKKVRYFLVGQLSKLRKRTKLHEGTKLHKNTKLHKDTFAKRIIFTRAQNCTQTKLHEGSLLHEDTFAQGYIFARADNFARRHFSTKGLFCTSDNFARRVIFARVLCKLVFVQKYLRAIQ